MSERVYVFLHGSPGSRDDWSPLIAHAPSGVRCEAWDLLDHGASSAPEATLEDTVDDVVARVHAIGVPVTLVGHSFGSWVGARALPLLGASVSRYVAIAGIPGMTPEIAERSLGFAAALEAGQLPLPAGAQAAVQLWLTASNPDPAHVARIAALIETDTVERLARILRRQAGMADPARRVLPFEARATFIHCKDDRGVPIALGRELAALGAGSRFVELEGDEHFPHWTRADLVGSIVFAD